ncbi:stromal cell-derived factor 2 [Planococcus citri]|uniref:stromal cell-derived factor 2 n=1 Tax=Planococcus citri TaxID=170843 RepID=UPI0031F7877D
MFVNNWLLFHVGFLISFVQRIPFIYAKSPDHVTCGSVLKLYNIDYKIRLHSHDVKYGSGSGQQSVTGTTVPEDINSHWAIKAVTGQTCVRGESIKCGDTIRLQHLSTTKNLHSHFFSSPLSGHQEISCYGNNGEGDSGDHWKVVCDDEYWNRSRQVKFQHADTKMFLAATQQTYGRPISGQHEIVGVGRQDAYGTAWKPMEGVFIHKSDFNPKELHDEL